MRRASCKKFYAWEPGENFKYATLGLLLAAVSAGGTLTHFSAPRANGSGAWDWDSAFMFWNFGLKSGIAIFAGALIVMFMFGKEFSLLKLKAADAPQTVQKRPRAKNFSCRAFGFSRRNIATLHHPTLMIFIFSHLPHLWK
ncbi:MAG: putative Na+/H+ antiporter [Bacilli bacterium]